MGRPSGESRRQAAETPAWAAGGSSVGQAPSPGAEGAQHPRAQARSRNGPGCVCEGVSGRAGTAGRDQEPSRALWSPAPAPADPGVSPAAWKAMIGIQPGREREGSWVRRRFGPGGGRLNIGGCSLRRPRCQWLCLPTRGPEPGSLGGPGGGELCAMEARSRITDPPRLVSREDGLGVLLFETTDLEGLMIRIL